MIENLTGDKSTGVKKFVCTLNELNNLPKKNITSSSSAMVIEDDGEVKEFLFKRTNEDTDGKWVLKKNPIVGGVEQGYVDTALETKVDKVAGKGLSTKDFTDIFETKLKGLNNYVHPVNHPASIITQDATNRFITDSERTAWNGKSNFSGKYTDLTEKPTLLKGDKGDKGDQGVQGLKGETGTSGVAKDYVDGELLKKVNSVIGKGLSTVDFTTEKDTKLTGLSNYTHPNNTGNKHIPSGGSANQILRWASDGTATWGADSNTTYNASTTSALGLVKKCELQADSVATDIVGLVADFNSLLAKLKTAGLM